MTHRAAAAPAVGHDITRVMNALRSVVRALRLSSRAVERAIGISGAQLFVLEELDEEPARSVNELAERTSTHQSTVSIVVARLAQRGLVSREPAEEDARRLEISITGLGRELLAAAPETAQGRIVAALRRGSPDEVKDLADALAALVRGMGLPDAPSPMFLEEDDMAVDA